MNCCNDNCSPHPIRYIPRFAGFTEFTASIPKLYFNVKSQEQRILAMCELINKLICYADMLGDVENESQTIIKQLLAEFEEFKESGFLDYYEEQLEAWINANMEGIISKAIKMVFFGLTDDGYFCAYIPQSWAGITFDTGANYANDDYGRLILNY